MQCFISKGLKFGKMLQPNPYTPVELNELNYFNSINSLLALNSLVSGEQLDING